MKIVSVAVSGALLFVSWTAQAQSTPGFAVNRVEPSERGGGWFILDELDLRGHLRPAFGATADYAHKPLVVYDRAGRERAALVRHQLVTHLGGSLRLFDRVRVGVSWPIALYQDGERAFDDQQSLAPATRPALGDVRLAADVRLAGRHDGPATIAVGLRGWLPTGSDSQFAGDGSIRLAPQVIAAGNVAWLAWSARMAFVYRARDDVYGGTSLGSELTGALGVGVRWWRLLVGPEVFAGTSLGSEAFGADRTPADVVLGAHYRDPAGVDVAIGAGAGLSRGFGSPVARVLLTVEWGRAFVSVPLDTDGDGIIDDKDACPTWPGPASGDPEQHGCPPPERVPDEDADQDGVWDQHDACPTLAGVRHPDRMRNGCPADLPRQLAVVTSREILIAEQVRFATDRAEIAPESDPILDAVRKILEEHPQITKVRVEGHTDDVGDPAYNDDLSRRRAAAVVKWLTDHGIDARRLESKGYGRSRPLESNRTEEGREKNRRVVFTITESRK